MWCVYDQSEKNIEHHNYWHPVKPKAKLASDILKFVTSTFNRNIHNSNLWEDHDYLVGWVIQDECTAIFRVYDAGIANDNRPNRWMIVCNISDSVLTTKEITEQLQVFSGGQLLLIDDVADIFESNCKLNKEFDVEIIDFTIENSVVESIQCGAISSFYGTTDFQGGAAFSSVLKVVPAKNIAESTSRRERNSCSFFKKYVINYNIALFVLASLLVASLVKIFANEQNLKIIEHVLNIINTW